MSERVTRIIEEVGKAEQHMRHAQLIVENELRGGIVPDDVADLIDARLSPVLDRTIRISAFVASRTPQRRVSRGNVTPGRLTVNLQCDVKGLGKR